MKKIKKLEHLKLSSKSSSKIYGGCEFDDCGSQFRLNQSYPHDYGEEEDGEDEGESGGGSDPVYCNCGCLCMYMNFYESLAISLAALRMHLQY